MADMPRDLTRTMLAVLIIGSLIAASFLITRPFLAATVWATTLVIATWPVMLRVQRALGGRRGLAVAVMTLALLLIIVLPLLMAIGAIVAHSEQIIALVAALSSFHMPAPPAWLGDIPLIGEPAVEQWERIVDTGIGDLVRRLAPYAGAITQWFVEAAGSLGVIFLHLLMTVAIAAVLYGLGETAAGWCRRFGRRLAGDRGEEAP